MSSIDYRTLYNRYQRSLKRKGESWFEENILNPLYEEEKDGVVVSTGVMDENTTIRRSAIPVELRISAAEGALDDYLDGSNSSNGGIKCISLNRGNSVIEN